MLYPMPDKIQIQVLADGTVKVSTDKISLANHLSAEKFLAQTFSLLGGEVKRKAKHAFQHAFGSQHAHDHDHDHQHQ